MRNLCVMNTAEKLSIVHQICAQITTFINDIPEIQHATWVFLQKKRQSFSANRNSGAKNQAIQVPNTAVPRMAT